MRYSGFCMREGWILVVSSLHQMSICKEGTFLRWADMEGGTVDIRIIKAGEYGFRHRSKEILYFLIMSWRVGRLIPSSDAALVMFHACFRRTLVICSRSVWLRTSFSDSVGKALSGASSSRSIDVKNL